VVRGQAPHPRRGETASVIPAGLISRWHCAVPLALPEAMIKSSTKALANVLISSSNLTFVRSTTFSGMFNILTRTVPG